MIKDLMTHSISAPRFTVYANGLRFTLARSNKTAVQNSLLLFSTGFKETSAIVRVCKPEPVDYYLCMHSTI